MLPRNLGESLAISIGTSVPIEKIIVDKEIRKPYSNIYLNIRTLYRNFHNSLANEYDINFNEISKEFKNELTIIKTLLEQSSSYYIKPIFYITTHKSLETIFYNAKLKKPTTKKQQNYDQLEKKIINYLLKHDDEEQIQIYDILVKGYKTKSLILTHMPIDLLSYYSFRQLALIESNTGKIKLKSEWITKLTNNSDYYHLPFNLLVIQILGDGGKTFYTMDNSYKKLLLELASSNRWNPNTTVEKIKFDIRKMKDRFSSEILLKMTIPSLV